MQKVSGTMIRGILFGVLMVGSLVVRARANALIWCEECYGTWGTPAYCQDKEDGRIKNGTCKANSKNTCLGVKCGTEGEEEEFEADGDIPEGL
jgi:hypothetical protein